MDNIGWGSVALVLLAAVSTLGAPASDPTPGPEHMQPAADPGRPVETASGSGLPEIPGDHAAVHDRSAGAAAHRPTHVVPLRFLAAGAMQELLEPYARTGMIFRADAARNWIAFSGSPQDVAAVLEMIATLDVEWMARKAIRAFPLRSQRADDVADRLEALLGPAGPLAEFGPVRLLPITRAETLVAVADDAAAIARLRPWIAAMDSNAHGPGLHAYTFDHARSQDVAGPLSDVLRTANDRPRVAAVAEGNAVLVLARSPEWPSIQAALEKLDTRSRQVRVDVHVLEADVPEGQGVDVRAILRPADPAAVAGVAPGFSWTLTRGDLTAILQTLSLVSKARLIAQSSVVARSGARARAEAGIRIPLPSVSLTTAPVPVTGVGYIATGAFLQVEARANANGYVVMDLVQERRIPALPPEGGQALALASQGVRTSIALPDGATVLLAGLSELEAAGSARHAVRARRAPSSGATAAWRRHAARRETLVLITATLVQDPERSRSDSETFHRRFNALKPLRIPRESAVAARPGHGALARQPGSEPGCRTPTKGGGAPLSYAHGDPSRAPAKCSGT